MSLAALHQLIRSRLGLNLSRPMLVRVAEVSGGNPYFALEISGALARDHTQPALGDLLPVPRTLQDLLSDRIDRLSTAARAVASAAAAISRPTTETVGSAVGPDLDVDAALIEAEVAGVLVSDGDRLRFSHPLLASAIYGSLTAGQRRALHRRLAAIVSDPEERARHLARSPSTANEGAASTIEEAAALATRRGAPESAAELYDAACRLTPAEQPEDLARRMLGGADARADAGDLGGARTLATRALETGRTGSLRARAFLLLGSLASYTETIEARIDYQERALAEAGDDLALRVEILLALVEQIAVDPDKAVQRADEAIDLLRERDAAGPLARALISKFIAEAVLGRGANAHLLDEALALEAGSTGPVSTYPLLWFHWIDDLEATRARYRLHDERYRDRGDVVTAAEMVEFLAMAEFRAGNWVQAEQALEDACGTLAQFELRGPFVASFADRSVIDAHRGRIGRARRTLLDILGVERLDMLWQMVCHSAQGVVEFCAGDYAAADRAWTQMRNEARGRQVVRLPGRPQRAGPRRGLARARQPGRGTPCARPPGVARTHPATLVDRCRPSAGPSAGPRRRGQAGGSPGDHRLRRPRSRRCRSSRARLLLVKGQIERRANRKLAARASLAEALAVFEDLGSPPWAQRARDEIARLGLRHRAAWRADGKRTPNRRAGGSRDDESASGGSSVCQPQDGRGESRPRLPEAGHPFAGRARGPDGGQVAGGRDPDRRETPDVSVTGGAIASRPRHVGRTRAERRTYLVEYYRTQLHRGRPRAGGVASAGSGRSARTRRPARAASGTRPSWPRTSHSSAWSRRRPRPSCAWHTTGRT